MQDLKELSFAGEVMLSSSARDGRFKLYAFLDETFGADAKDVDIDVATLYVVIFYVTSKRGMWTMHPLLINFDATVVILDEWVRENSYFLDWSQCMYPGCRTIIGTATLPMDFKDCRVELITEDLHDQYDLDAYDPRSYSMCDLVEERSQTPEFGTGLLNCAVHWDFSHTPCLASQFRTLATYLTKANQDHVIFDTSKEDENTCTVEYFFEKAKALEIHQLSDISPDDEIISLKERRHHPLIRRVYKWNGMIPWVDGTTADGKIRVDGSTELGKFLNSWIYTHILSNDDGILLRENAGSIWFAKVLWEKNLKTDIVQDPFRLDQITLLPPSMDIRNSMIKFKDEHKYNVDPLKIPLIAIAARTLHLLLQRFVHVQIDTAWKQDEERCDFWRFVSQVQNSAQNSPQPAAAFDTDMAVTVAKLILGFSRGEFEGEDDSVVDSQLIERFKAYTCNDHVMRLLTHKTINNTLVQPVPTDRGLWTSLVKLNRALDEYVCNAKWFSCIEAVRLVRALRQVMQHRGDACTKTICNFMLRKVRTIPRKDKSCVAMDVYQLFVPAYVRLINKVKQHSASSVCVVAMNPNCVFSKYVVWLLKNQHCSSCTYDLTSLDMMTDIVVFGNLAQNPFVRAVFQDSNLLSLIRKFVFNANWYANMKTTSMKSTRLKNMEKKIQNDMQTSSTVCILSDHMKKGSNVIAQPGSHLIIMKEEMTTNDIIQFAGRNTRFIQQPNNLDFGDEQKPCPTHIHFVQESLSNTTQMLRNHSLLSAQALPDAVRNVRHAMRYDGVSCRLDLLSGLNDIPEVKPGQISCDHARLDVRLTNTARFIPNFVGRGGNLVVIGNENVIDSTQFTSKRIKGILSQLKAETDYDTVVSLEEQLRLLDNNTMWTLSNTRLDTVRKFRMDAKIQVFEKMQRYENLVSHENTIATTSDPDTWAWEAIQRCKQNQSTHSFGMLHALTLDKIHA